MTRERGSSLVGGGLPAEPACRIAPPVALVDFGRELAAGWVETKARVTNRGELTIFEPIRPGGATLVVKTCPGWNETRVRRLVTTTSLCSEYALDHGAPAFVAALASWGIDPEYVCSEWIAGTSVDEWLAEELSGLSSSAAVARTLDVASAMAGLVAHFHEATAEHTRNAAAGTAMSDKLISALAGSSAVRLSIRVRTIDDPGPHNTIRDAAGELWLIDLPADEGVVLLERDLARLASRIVGSIHRHSTATWVPYEPVVEAVIEGYMRNRPDDIGVDRPLVYACLASDAATKAVLTRRRLPPGTRLECLVRETAAAVTLAAAALRSRLCRGS